MSKRNVARHRDVDQYIREIEEVYDVRLHFAFDPIYRVGQPMCRMVIKGWDKDDFEEEGSPLLYAVAEIPVAQTYRRQQALLAALTEITRQCLEALISRA